MAELRPGVQDSRRSGLLAAGLDPLAELIAWDKKLAALPPTPRAIRVHHGVPYGRCFKQWMTNGDMVVWANRGEIEDLPRVRASDAADPLRVLSGIPVVVER